MKKFYRHYNKKGFPLYWILLIYLIVGYFFPVVGLIAIICMIAPVAFSIKRGRWWCGNACPRGSLYDKLLSKYSPHKPIPAIVRTFGFRLFMVGFIFAMFGTQMYFAWGDWNAMGKVFWNIIMITTIVGVALSFIYAPRTWCSFCPMGTLSNWVAPKKMPLPAGYSAVTVSSDCNTKCKNCARMCPMQLAPYKARGKEEGYLDPDCLKCERCTMVCPLNIIKMKNKL